MKFTAIVILSTFALVSCQPLESSSHPDDSQQQGLFGKVNNVVESFVNKMKQPWNSAYEKSIQVFFDSFTKANELFAKFEKSLSLETAKLEARIESVKNKNETMKKCAEKAELELELLKNVTKDSFGNCKSKFIEEYGTNGKLMDNYVEMVRKKVEELRLAVVTCIHLNPVTTTKCVYSKFDEYKTIIGDTYKISKEGVDNVIKNVEKFSANLKKCYEKQANETVDEISRIDREINVCANNDLKF